MWTKNKPIDPIYVATNIHPNWRALSLSHIRQVRSMRREGRYAVDCDNIIRAARLDMLAKRRRLAQARNAA